MSDYPNLHRAILTEAIDKAIAGGWNYDNYISEVYGEDGSINKYIIFNHDFAKALWPIDDSTFMDRPVWQQHLRDMVVADDPIKYLGDNL